MRVEIGREARGGGSTKMEDGELGAGWEELREPRCHTSPNLYPPRVGNVALEPSPSSPPYQLHLQPHQSFFDHSNTIHVLNHHPHSTLQPTSQPQRFDAPPPPPQVQSSPSHPPQVHSLYSPLGYYPTQAPTFLRSDGQTQSRQHQSLLLDQSNASFINSHPSRSSSAPSHNYSGQITQHPSSLGHALPVAWASSSNFHPGPLPPVLCAGTCDGTSTSTRKSQEQQVWGQGSWDDLGE